MGLWDYTFNSYIRRFLGHPRIFLKRQKLNLAFPNLILFSTISFLYKIAYK